MSLTDPAHSSPLFTAPALLYPTADSPSSVAIADLDRDGHLDLVVTNRRPNHEGSVSVFLGHGDATFRARVDYPLAASPEGVAVADLDHDERPDVVVVSYGIHPDYAGTACVLLGNGDGTLRTSTAFAAGTQARSVCIADLDCDGDPDLVTAKSVLLGNGDGSFGPPSEFGVWTDTWAAVADLNGDGTLDVVTSIAASPPEYDLEPPIVSVRLGVGDGTLGPATGFGVGNNAHSVVIADMDRDGRPDLVVGNFADDDTGSDYNSTVSVLRNLGGGTFGGPGSFPTGMNPFAVAVADLDDDGWPDIATANFTGDPDFNPNSISVLLANRDGNYRRARDLPGGEYPHALAVGDLDGDRILDLVAVNVSNTLSVMLGNGDGTFGARTFTTSHSARDLFPADLDGDGDLDLVVESGGERRTTVATLLGRGDGMFGTSTDFGDWAHSIFATVGDVNADGRPDVAVVSEGEHIVSTLMGNGDGTLGLRTDHPTGQYPKGVQILDLDADGFTDLVVANALVGSLSVFPGTGPGVFGAAVDYETGRFPELLAKSDLNRDGHWDLVVGNAGSATVSVFLGGREGTLSRIDLPTGGGPRFASVADLDGDGHLDLALVAGPSVILHRGHGDGTFDAGIPVIPHEDAFSVACADLDADGKLDLAVTYPYSRTVSILLGHGDFTFEPPIDLGAYAYGIATADVNHDGMTDLMVAGGPITVLLNRTPPPPVTPPPGGSGLALRIAPVSRSPGHRLHLAVTLAEDGPATLHLLDLAGRIQASRRLGALGPGVHELSLEAREPLRPGIYFLRLTQAGRVANARTVVLR